MSSTLNLHSIDWYIIIAYILLVLGIGFLSRKKASRGKEDYFLAGRSTPWWLAGISITATKFAADTPLFVTGIVATKGISGNWIWLSLLGVHVALFIFFAAMWNRSGVLTDAEIIEMRYSGKVSQYLRLFRAFFYGLVFNCIIMGWVLLGMTKVVIPFFHWDIWCPGLIHFLNKFWSDSFGLGSPSEFLSIFVLLCVAGLYSSLGGIRGGLIVDFIQFCLAMSATVMFSIFAWDRIGWRDGLYNGLQELYGKPDFYLDLFPKEGSGWIEGIGMSFTLFCVYLVAQSFSNKYADGGGYLMQKINTTGSDVEARKAALVFIIFQYVIRCWPWFIIGLAAVILMPIGSETSILGSVASLVRNDREIAYPVLMGYILGPGLLGIMVTSMLASFMGTIHTHINWGASYVVNDVYLKIRPNASNQSQILVARLAVFGFIALAIFISLKMHTIEQAWKFLSLLAASLGIPTVLRWFWWRINAWSEICSLITGIMMVTALLTTFQDVPYEIKLIYVCLSSIVGMLLGVLCGKPTDLKVIQHFVDKVQPIGFWPGYTPARIFKDITINFSRWGIVIVGVILSMLAIHNVLFVGNTSFYISAIGLGIFFIWLGGFYRFNNLMLDKDKV